MPNRWALWLVWLFVELAWPGLVLAADACSYLFFNPSTHLAARSCDGDSASDELEKELSPSCQKAARSGAAEESIQRLAALVQDPERTRALPCPRSRRQLAQYALCLLRPPHHRELLRMGIRTKAWSDFGERFVAKCVESLLEAGEASALDDAYESFRPFKTRERESRWAEMLYFLVWSKFSAVRERVFSRLEWAAQQGLSERWVLERGLCLRDPPESVRERGVCQRVRDAETSRLEQAVRQNSLGLFDLHEQRCMVAGRKSPREEALCKEATVRMDEEIRHARQRHGRQDRQLRAGLSVLTVLASGVRLGLTIQYRDHVAGQILQTVGGVGTSVLLERAVLRHQGISGLPDVLISMAALPPIMALGGGIGYASSLNSETMIVVASINTAFAVGSTLRYIWTKE